MLRRPWTRGHARTMGQATDLILTSVVLRYSSLGDRQGRWRQEVASSSPCFHRGWKTGHPAAGRCAGPPFKNRCHFRKANCLLRSAAREIRRQPVTSITGDKWEVIDDLLPICKKDVWPN